MLVLRIVKGETSVAEAARTHGMRVEEVEEWRDRFSMGAENALRTRPKDEEALSMSLARHSNRKLKIWLSTRIFGRGP